MMSRVITAAMVFCVTVAGTAVAQTAGGDKVSSPTEGPSSLQETFENWTVRCAVTEKERNCNVQQQQRHRDTRQIVLAAEFAAAANGTLNGFLLLPFGLRLGDGAVLQIDDQQPPLERSFSTCLPLGCVVPVTFDNAAVVRLRNASILKVGAVANEGGKKIELSVPLQGLNSALNRLAGLAQSGDVAKKKRN